MKHSWLIFLLLFVTGCSTANEILGTGKLPTPPEYNQKVLLKVSDEYEMHQAPRSGYDIGDLQAFHSQHTLPIVIEDAFKEVFGQVDMVQSGPQIESGAPDVPAVFEVRIIDLAHDIYNEATSYRAHVTLAVAMKSPKDNIFWQQSFRGEGYTKVDPQFGTGMGPDQAVLDAMNDAINQMQKALISSPQVRNQMKYYMDIENARKAKETQV